MMVVGIGVGSIITGGDVLTPVLGTLVIGLYALALAGIGIAWGGVVGTSFAGEIVAVVVIVTFMIDFLVPPWSCPTGCTSSRCRRTWGSRWSGSGTGPA